MGRLQIGMAVFVLITFARGDLLAQAPDISVRAELEQLQKKNGITIAIFNYQGIGINLFRKHQFVFRKQVFEGDSVAGALSRDGTEVAVSHLMSRPSTLVIMHPDGSGLREYSGIQGGPMCWSYDNSKLVFGTQGPKLLVLELAAKFVQELPTEALSSGVIVTSQCWSPDGKQIAYESNDGNVYLYDFEKRNSTKLTKGTGPTWSPDGNWIAYQDDDTYYAIHPDGGHPKKLFRRTRAVSALYWSPDSRFVAYVHQDFFALDTEFYHLMVRRLEDGSEDWIADGEDASWAMNYQWVTNPQLLERVKSQATSR